VAVDQDGSLRFEGRPVTSAGLQGELASIAGIDSLKIYADAKVSALVVSKIMKAASEAGVLKFILITQQRTGG